MSSTRKDFPHHGLDPVFAGHAGRASAVLDGDTLGRLAEIDASER